MGGIDSKPKHIALIMDGNRRWAKARGLPRFRGHKEGERRIEPIVDRAIELGIPYLTFWAFAVKNWRRTKEEIDLLLNLFRGNLNKQVDRFHRKSVKVQVIGNLAMFPEDIQALVAGWTRRTQNNRRITVNIALSYGGRDEIVRAINRLRCDAKLQISNSEISEVDFAKYLDTAGQPDPDLLIRTGRQKRLSGFLPWQTTYTELYFTNTLWPDFTVEEFERAIEWYLRQKRNFGR